MWLNQLIALSRVQKRRLQIVADISAVLAAFSLAWLISGFSFAGEAWLHFLMVAGVLIILAPAAMMILGTYRAIVRFVHASFTFKMLFASVIVSVAGFLLVGWLTGAYKPRFLADLLGLFLFFATVPRLLFRWVVEHRKNSDCSPALVYGCGSAGRQLVAALKSGNEYNPVAFVDDDPSLDGASMLDLPVYSPRRLEKVVKAHSAEVVLLALPAITRVRRREILSKIEPLPVRVQTIPAMADLVSGRAKISELRNIAIEDLLGREPVKPYPDLITANTTGKPVMITGAGGSIGSELARQALRQSPTELVLYEQSEFQLYAIEADLRALAEKTQSKTQVRAVLGSVTDDHRMRDVCRQYQVKTVYHAAAYKHVPLVEANPIEGLKNNVLGTWKAANAAVAAGVDTFVLISTDKAVRPTNVMGASKRIAELAVQALAQRYKRVNFGIVRFGNVLGSSGSVVPKFRAQIAQGGPITVTHPDIIRYFMTIPEAAQLVIQAGALGNLGEVFLLDMGEPVKIVDLAEKMIHLSGLTLRNEKNPDGDIGIVFTGLRPGEKLYEELLIGEADRKTVHPRIRVSDEPYLAFDEFVELLYRLESYIAEGNLAAIYDLLLEIPADWLPSREKLVDHGLSTRLPENVTVM